MILLKDTLLRNLSQVLRLETYNNKLKGFKRQIHMNPILSNYNILKD